MSASFEEFFKKGIAPEKRLKVWEWSDQHRVLSSRASSEPGRYRTSRTPYMKEIMEELSTDSFYQEIVFMKASQIGATETMANWLGYIIDHSPAPTLFVQPTTTLAIRASKQRVDPLIDESPQLRQKIKPARSRDSGNTQLMKDFMGGTLVMTGANSAVGLRSMPARFIAFDEVDAYPFDADGEGSPIELAKARSRTFHNRKVFYASTPTVDGRSEIQRLYEMSDKRVFEVPCPHCGTYQTLIFENLKYENDDPKTARYECEECKKQIENWQKTEMLNKGRWIKQDEESSIAGFHINALYSPVGWYSWEEIIADWLNAKKSIELKRTFVNTVLGETWVDRGEAPDWNRLYERRSDYKIGTVPKGVCFLTCGVDVQQDRIEAQIVGWGRNKVSWSIDYRILRGDSSEKEVWSELDALLNESFPNEAGTLFPIRLMAVDSGYNTQVVYDWCRRYSMTRVIAVKGSDTLSTIVGHPKPVDVTSRGRVIRHGIKAWPVGVNLIKQELYGFLRQNAPIGDEETPYGFCHFPEYSDEFFKQLTAEELKIKIVKGYKKLYWEKIRDRNEALDTFVYARAAASVIGLDRFTEAHYKKMESEISIEKPAKKSENQNKTGIKRRKSEWL